MHEYQRKRNQISLYSLSCSHLGADERDCQTAQPLSLGRSVDRSGRAHQKKSEGQVVRGQEDKTGHTIEEATWKVAEEPKLEIEGVQVSPVSDQETNWDVGMDVAPLQRVV